MLRLAGSVSPRSGRARDPHLARVGPQQARDHGDGGGFAGAVGTQEADRLAFGRAKGDAVDGYQIAVSFSERGDLEHFGFRKYKLDFSESCLVQHMAWRGEPRGADRPLFV